ncbi:MAG TPA: geranylgeranyl diphosphate reductase [Steroidobacteraceae bacterium]|nr:geranylgeranyl diphosphate reductase [Steroidobacteraceae bacterium]
MEDVEQYEVIVVGGGPAGATAAADLAAQGRRVLLLDRAGRIKPCGGAVPPKLVDEFAIPGHLLVARITAARMTSPVGRIVDMPIAGGFVGMVDREHFDDWLRQRAVAQGATLREGEFTALTRDERGQPTVHFAVRDSHSVRMAQARSAVVIGADGARSAVAREVCGTGPPCVFAYHEIVRSPQANGVFDAARCEIVYRGGLSPDFYAWIFPHGETTSVGVGSAVKGFSLRRAVQLLRHDMGLKASPTIRREGAPIPLKPLRRWDNGRDVVLAGDAAGVVAPASGEGIYYAMTGGRLAAQAAHEYLQTGNVRSLASARRRFMSAHGRVFWVLGIMQKFWYSSDSRRERFVSICRDRDVQRLTWEAYLHKRLVRARPLAHGRIFFKDLLHLCGIVPP